MPIINGSDPSLTRDSTTPSVARTSPPTVSTSGTATSSGSTIARGITPIVSDGTTTYPSATENTSTNSVTITSSVNNGSGDVVTVYTSPKEISVSSINQTINQYTSLNSGVSEIIAGNGVTISSTGTGGTGAVTISAASASFGNIAVINLNGNPSTVLRGDGTWGVGSASYGNSNVATFLASYGSNTITTTGNVSVGNIIATNIGNISSVDLDGSSSNVLFGNGVFAPVTAGANAFTSITLVDSPAGSSNIVQYGLGNLVGYLDGGWVIGEYNGSAYGTEGIRISPGIEGSAEVNIPSNSGAATNPLGVNNYAGNVVITTGNGVINPIWKFDGSGQINIPEGSASFQLGRIQSANGYPTLLGYGSGEHGGPELDWMDSDDPANSFTDNTVIRNTMYINNGGLYIGMNENFVANVAVASWNFNSTGTLTLPNDVTQNTSGSVTCNAGAPTVIYTATSSGKATLKLLIQVEGVETIGQQWDTQSCEMVVARGLRNNNVVGSVYGLAYTSTNPLATFNAIWNNATSRVEITCTPISLTFGVEARVSVIEMITSA